MRNVEKRHLPTLSVYLTVCNHTLCTFSCSVYVCECVYAEYCTEMRTSGPQCSLKFRHEAGRVTGSPVAPPGPGQYSVTTFDRPRSAAFTFGCSRPQSGMQTARCAHVICSLAAALPCSMVHTPGKEKPFVVADLLCSSSTSCTAFHGVAEVFCCLFHHRNVMMPSWSMH